MEGGSGASLWGKMALEPALRSRGTSRCKGPGVGSDCGGIWAPERRLLWLEPKEQRSEQDQRASKQGVGCGLGLEGLPVWPVWAGQCQVLTYTLEEPLTAVWSQTVEGVRRAGVPVRKQGASRDESGWVWGCLEEEPRHVRVKALPIRTWHRAPLL